MADAEEQQKPAAKQEEKEPAKDAAANDEKQADDGKKNNNSNNNQGNKKRKKKDITKNTTRRFSYDENIDERTREPHGGSFASEEMQKMFGVEMPDWHGAEKDENVPKTVKRKVALLLGFLGTKYAGFQMNAGQRSLQAEVELAAYKSKMISKPNFGFPHKYSYSSSARTDKGVHACAQVVSLKLELEEAMADDMDAVRERIQAQMPEDIKLLDINRTTRAFCAHTGRDRVRYQYMIPSFLLHPDIRSVFAECDIKPGNGELTKEQITAMQAKLAGYRSTSDQVERLKSALSRYVGTHAFYNFTKGVSPGEGTGSRYIISFEAQDAIVVDGIEWIPTQVLGQSFLLHQIRKMVSLAVDVARGVVEEDIMDKALARPWSYKKKKTEDGKADDSMTTNMYDKDIIVRVGMAPPHGLFLEMSYFVGYNRRKPVKDASGLSDLDWTVDSPARDRWSSFRDVVRAHVVNEEAKEGNFIKYLYNQEFQFNRKDNYEIDSTNDVAGGKDKEGIE